MPTKTKKEFRMLRVLRLKKNQARLLRIVGYPVFAIAVFVTSFYFSLPLDRIKDRLQRELSQESGPPAPGSGSWGIGIGMDVTIGDLGLHLLPVGAGASDVTLRPRLAPGASPDSTQRPKAMFVEQLRLRAPIMALLSGDRVLGVDVEAMGGTVSADGGLTGDGGVLRAELDKLTLARAPILAQFVPLPVLGVLSGSADIKVPLRKAEKEAPSRRAAAGPLAAPLDYSKTNGLLEIRIEQGVLGDGKAKLAVPGDPFLSQGLTFPKLSLGNVTARVVFDRGRATLSDVRSQSGDAEISLEGYIELRDPPPLSELHLYLRFRPSPALLKREPTMEILSNAMAAGKRADGSLGFALTGTVANPRSRPAKDPPDGVSIRSGSLGAAPKDAAPSLQPAPRATFPSPPPASPPPASPPPPSPAAAAPPSGMAPPSFVLPSVPAPPPAPPAGDTGRPGEPAQDPPANYPRNQRGF
jgi:type II secretion system protein N